MTRSTETSTVLFLNGVSARYTIYTDSHTGEPYVYARNANGIVTRVYLDPGESVSYVEKLTTGNSYCSVLEHTRAPVHSLAA
jgi:hypothetical protein